MATTLNVGEHDNQNCKYASLFRPIWTAITTEDERTIDAVFEKNQIYLSDKIKNEIWESVLNSLVQQITTIARLQIIKQRAEKKTALEVSDNPAYFEHYYSLLTPNQYKNQITTPKRFIVFIEEYYKHINNPSAEELGLIIKKQISDLTIFGITFSTVEVLDKHLRFLNTPFKLQIYPGNNLILGEIQQKTNMDIIHKAYITSPNFSQTVFDVKSRIFFANRISDFFIEKLNVSSTLYCKDNILRNTLISLIYIHRRQIFNFQQIDIVFNFISNALADILEQINCNSIDESIKKFNCKYTRWIIFYIFFYNDSNTAIPDYLEPLELIESFDLLSTIDLITKSPKTTEYIIDIIFNRKVLILEKNIPLLDAKSQSIIYFIVLSIALVKPKILDSEVFKRIIRFLKHPQGINKTTEIPTNKIIINKEFIIDLLIRVKVKTEDQEYRPYTYTLHTGPNNSPLN